MSPESAVPRRRVTNRPPVKRTTRKPEPSESFPVGADALLVASTKPVRPEPVAKKLPPPPPPPPPDYTPPHYTTPGFADAGFPDWQATNTDTSDMDESDLADE